MAVDKVQFYELSQSVYDNLENKEPYSFYDTEDNVYLGDKILTEGSSSSTICLSATIYSSQWMSEMYYLTFDLSEYHLNNDDTCGILGFSSYNFTESNAPRIGIFNHGVTTSEKDGTIGIYFFYLFYPAGEEAPTEDIDVNLILFKK